MATRDEIKILLDTLSKNCDVYRKDYSGTELEINEDFVINFWMDMFGNIDIKDLIEAFVSLEFTLPSTLYQAKERALDIIIDKIEGSLE